MLISQRDLRDAVRALLAQALQIPLDEVTPELSFGDLPQWDSLGHMEVMMNLEEKFAVEITTETISELTSVPAICSYLEKRSRKET